MKVAIIGAGQTSYGVHRDRSIDELVFEAARNALDDAGLERDDIESVVTAGSDGMDGRAISNMLTAGAAGAYLKDEVKVSDGGIFALVMGYLRVASGVFRNSLIVSWTKSSETSPESVSNLSSEPFFSRALGLNHITSLALEACSFMYKANLTEEDAGAVVLKNRANGLKNPHAHIKEKTTSREIASDGYVSYPIRGSHLPPGSDGACALVIASGNIAKSLKGNCAWIEGLGWAIDEYDAGFGSAPPLNSLRKSSETAYRASGIKNPLREINVAEISDVSAYHEIMIYEALGFCGDGEGRLLIADGITKAGGGLPVNPSGGILCSNPFFASSLVRVAEAYLQVTGKAGKRQIGNAELALAQGFTAMSIQGSCVAILRR